MMSGRESQSIYIIFATYDNATYTMVLFVFFPSPHLGRKINCRAAHSKSTCLVLSLWFIV